MNTPLQLSVQYAAAATCPSRPRVRRWVQAALQATGARDAQLLLRFVDEDEGRALNRDYRRKDYATNVLTFDYSDADSAAVSADIIVCATVVEREAQQQHKPLDAHYAHLIVHGVLHACGYEHEKAADARAMENLERSVMARLRFADPYGEAAPMTTPSPALKRA